MANVANSRTRTWRRGVFTCLVIAAAARIAMCLYAAGQPVRFDYPDSQRYLAVARNIAAGDGPMESAAVRCGTDPGYPYLLAIAPLMGRGSTDELMNWGRVVNTILGLLAIVAAMRLARRAAGVLGAVVAGLIMALDPIFLFFHALVLTEIAFTCLILWGSEWLLRAIETRRMGYVVLSAAALAGGTLTRSSGLLFPLLLLPVIFVEWYPPRQTWAAAGAFFLTYALALLPTAIRNYHILGAFVPVRTGLGGTLLDSFGPWADGGTGMQRIIWPVMRSVAGEYERETICCRAAFERIREDPARAIALAGAKLKRTWSIVPHAPGYGGRWYRAIAWVTVLPVYVLAVVGAWRSRGRGVLLYTILAPAILVTILHCVIVGSVRYRVPAMPGLFVLAATGITGFFARRGRSDGTEQIGA